MITYWQQVNGKLVDMSREELDSEKNTWVDARCVTRDDIKELQEEYGIEQENILDFLDPDELSRLEKNDETGYTVTILRLPVFSPSDDVSYFTAPLGIITLKKFFITICWTDCEVLKDFAANRIRELSLNDFPAFTIRFMARADIMFLRYLKELNRRATTIQNEMLRSVQNHELVQLLNIQKSLVYFSTSLKTNQMLLEKYRKTKIIKLDEEDQDWIDDVEIDNRQALEMADTYTNIMAQMNDASASLISNNLSIVMKRMTLISLVIAIPTFITSFFGMNIPLPFASSGWNGIIAITLLCILSSTFGWWIIFKTSKYAQPVYQRRRKSMSQYRAEKKQKRIIKKQEKTLEKTK